MTNRSVQLNISPNEIFYEIFDYLNGIRIHEAFSNLNDRFQQLLNSSSLLFKIEYYGANLDKGLSNYWKRMIDAHRHQIYSIQLGASLCPDELLAFSFILNSSLNHLESLFLSWEIDLDLLMSILGKLAVLPRLFSLKISVYNDFINLTEIYPLIFRLPMLKYYKFYISEFDLPVSLAMATGEEFTPIESLNIDHCCTFQELSTIVSYTPELRRLRFTDDSGSRLKSGISFPINLPYLTDVSMESFSVTFDQWEMFIGQIGRNLKGLSLITRSEDISFLDAHRWQCCILQHLPRLENFSLHYHESIEVNDVFQPYPGEANQFTSSFWIERQWLFETKIDYDCIIYSIRPYK